MKILAIKTRALGDSVIATAAIQYLAQYGAVDFAVTSAAAPLLKNLSFINQTIEINEPKGLLKRILYWFHIIRDLRSRGYSRVAVFHGSYKLAIIAKLIGLFKSKIIVNHHKLNGGFIHKLIFLMVNKNKKINDFGILKSNIQRDLDCAKALFSDSKNKKFSTALVVTENEKQEAANHLKSLGWQNKAPLIFLGVGASKETKRWPMAHFENLIKKIKYKNPNCQFVMATVNADKEWFKKIGYSESENIINIQTTDLRQVMAVISHCAEYVGNDSGMKHVAIALGVPTVTIFGPETPFEWHPYDVNRNPYFFIDNLSCRTASGNHWCGISECHLEQNRCTKDISPESVANVVLDSLVANSTSGD